MNTEQLQLFVHLVEVVAWPIVALVAIGCLRKPVTALVARTTNLKLGRDGIELIVKALEEEVTLQPGQRAELLGLSSNEIWALEGFCTGQISKPGQKLKPAQSVAARVLSDAGLLKRKETPEGATFEVTELGESVLRVASSLV